MITSGMMCCVMSVAFLEHSSVFTVMGWVCPTNCVSVSSYSKV